MNKEKKSFIAVGIMSGTSVDGLDLALCRFEKVDGDWNFEILKTKTLSYSGTEWPVKLAGAETADGYTLMELHRDFGRFTGEAAKDFLEEVKAEYDNDASDNGTAPDTGIEKEPGRKSVSGSDKAVEKPHPFGDKVSDTFLKPDIIASHGHTIFHRPERGLTLQIGDGAEIAAVTGITTVSDFRRLDVALGGQGAPLVPVGDELLFGRYGYCLNLGGFANISFRESGKRAAFDICPVNIVLNRLSRKLGMDYDRDGKLAASGKIIPGLLAELEKLDFYQLTGPRSLGKEWVDEIFMPVMDMYEGTVEDKMRTVCEHIAQRIGSVINTGQYQSGKNNRSPTLQAKSAEGTGTDAPSEQGSSLLLSLLATGGGTKNRFLMELIAEKVSPVSVTIPDEELIDFKEAVVFAFLGVLRLRNEPNCLAAVTGAGRDNSGGIIHLA